MIKKQSLAKDIETCLNQILGVSVGSANRTKIKSGAVVYRITGTPNVAYEEETNRVFSYGTGNDGRRVEITLDTRDEVNDTTHNYIGAWEIALLTRGRAKTCKELQDALTRLGHAVEVRPASNSGWYPASLAIEQLSKPVKPGDKFDAKMLAGEMIALGETLAPIQKTLDDVSLRLRALGIALTINLKD
jgi:hypothetical protein